MSKTESCPVCGKSEFALHQDAATITAPDDVKLPYSAEFSKCSHCGEEFYTRSQSRAASRSASSALRVHLGLLAPEEILAIRMKHQLTQGQLEQELGLGKKTVVRWEAGTVNQSRAADRLLRQFRESNTPIVESATGDVEGPGSDVGDWSIEVIRIGEPTLVAMKVTEGRSSARRKVKKSPWKLRAIRGARRGAYGNASTTRTVPTGENCADGGLLIKVG